MKPNPCLPRSGLFVLSFPIYPSSVKCLSHGLLDTPIRQNPPLFSFRIHDSFFMFVFQKKNICNKTRASPSHILLLHRDKSASSFVLFVSVAFIDLQSKATQDELTFHLKTPEIRSSREPVCYMHVLLHLLIICRHSVLRFS